MRAKPATDEELRVIFNNLVDHPISGGVPSDTGLDDDTIEALNRLWAAGPNPPARLIDAARAEFEAQLDGSHAQEAQDRMVAAFNAAVAGRSGS